MSGQSDLLALFSADMSREHAVRQMLEAAHVPLAFEKSLVSMNAPYRMLGHRLGVLKGAAELICDLLRKGSGSKRRDR